MIELLHLKKTQIKDLDTLFQIQANEEGVWMAAFTSEDPNDKKAFMDKWSKIIINHTILMQTIWFQEKIVGSVVHFDVLEETNVSYSIDRDLWGTGIATKALKEFVLQSKKRPLYARVAFDNIGSQRVLEKTGFIRIGKERGYANARKKEIEEFVYKFV